MDRWWFRRPAELRGIAAQRARVALASRLGARLYTISQAWRRGNPSAVAGGAAASVAGDIVQSWVLARTDRLLFGPRLVADVADTALWARLTDAPPEGASLIGVPFGLELGLRVGPAGLVLPAAQYVVTRAVRRRAGLATSVGAFGWVAAAVGIGTLVHRYEEHLREVALDEHRDVLAARLDSATLAGQHEVAMGADSVVDLLARTEYLLAVADPRGAEAPGTARVLAAWKTSLAAGICEDVAYLAVALLRWQRRRQGIALVDEIELVVDEIDAAVIISATQAEALGRLLDSLDLRGRVEVRVLGPGAGVAGDGFTLDVGGRIVEVPGDARPRVREIDPAPIVVLSGVMYCLSLSTGGHGRAPWPLTILGAAAGGAAAWWAHGEIQRWGAVAAERVLAATVAVGLGQAALASLRLRSPYDHEGVQNFPFLMTVTPVSVLLGRYRPVLSPGALVRCLAATGAALAVSLALLPRPLRRTDLLIAVTEQVAVYAASRYLHHELERDRTELVDEMDRRDRAALSAARGDGRRSVVALVGATLLEAEARLAAVAAAPGADAAVVEEIERRLAEARAAFADLGAAG